MMQFSSHFVIFWQQYLRSYESEQNDAKIIDANYVC